MKCCAAHTYKRSLSRLDNVEKKHQGLDLIIPSTNGEWLVKKNRQNSSETLVKMAEEQVKLLRITGGIV